MAESSLPGSNALEVSVSELSGKLKRTVEDTFGHVRVRGEISGFRGPHSSGHCYFSLKDAKARLEAVIWRGQAAKMKHLPEEGLEVIASGKLTTFPGSSKYQIVIDNIEPAGAGALMALLEERRKKLAAEGLFEDGRKQLLPFMPKTIAVITSPTGAVIRDILHRLKDRFPVHVMVWPVRVQGETSGKEVANGVFQLNALDGESPLPRPDLIIVARGGGSLEDLWGFNDEALVRAVADSMIPVISAVGHETDWTLIDHAADWRAPTPTAAAEKAVPVKADLHAYVADLGARLRGAISRLGEKRRTDLRSAQRGLKSPDTLLAMPRRQFDETASRLERELKNRVTLARSSYQRSASRLSPLLLARIVKTAKERLERIEKDHQKSLILMIRARKERFQSIARQIRITPIQNQMGRAQERLERASKQIRHSITNTLKAHQENHRRFERLLLSFSYHSVLARGFAVIRDQNNQPLTHIASIAKGAELTIEMQDGRINTFTDKAAIPPHHDTPANPANPPQSIRPVKPTRAKKTPLNKDTDDQGSLF